MQQVAVGEVAIRGSGAGAAKVGSDKNRQVVRDVVFRANRGLTRKEVLKLVGAGMPPREVDDALNELVAESVVVRAGSIGAGYRYWPGNEQ